jgi:hypothetical protein
LVILIGVLLVAVSGFFYIQKTRNLPTTNTTPQACTQEAKQCSNGSYVGRTGPNCAFAECPTPNVSSSGIKGVVLLGPTCPVERNPPDPQCNDKPYQGNFVLTSPDATRILKTFSSDVSGKFTVRVSPGVYAIRLAPSQSPYPRCNSAGTIQVGAGVYTTASISCDTGIR